MALPKRSPVADSSPRGYPAFDRLDGTHPLQKAVPDSVVLYKVRTRKGGKLSYFNYRLAREMGLIPKDHPDRMNKRLEEKILYTFGLVIINEYDGLHQIDYPKEEVRPNRYMATRYLQSQHPGKRGLTSGDGRSIWNGVLSHRGRSWDISCCGTGATILSPASNINDKFYKTGDDTISYGCGYSELDEGLSTALFSEIMERNNVPTERVLAVIDYGGGLGVAVRAYDNLIRPSHMFNYLKQGDYENLKKVVDYYIKRQTANKGWTGVPKTERGQYLFFRDWVLERFAKISALFEDEYIFCWMDWDGDNILLDGGIIDYGSVRQFGLFHAEYRFDDVDRYSTTIVEQKSKAKYIVQTVIQLVDYLLTKKKKNIRSFANSKVLGEFEKIFEREKDLNLAYKMGFSRKDALHTACHHGKSLQRFRKVFSYFERTHSVRGPYKTSDGITRDAVFCMRDILRELPQIYLSRKGNLAPDEFIDIIKSTYAKKDDLKLSGYRKKKIAEFQRYYRKIVEVVAAQRKMSPEKQLLEMVMRSSIINKYDRVTGDSVTLVTERIIAHRPKLSPDEIFEVFSNFIRYQNFDPDCTESPAKNRDRPSRLMKRMISIVRDHREGL